MDKNASLLASNNGQFQLISDDDESLDDHSGLEDFHGVTLSFNESSLTAHEGGESVTPISPESTGHDNNNPSINKVSSNEAAAVLSSVSICTYSSTVNKNTSNFSSANINGISSTNSVPKISVTPITPESPTERGDNILLPFQPKAYPVPNSKTQSNHYWRAQSPIPPSCEGEAREFFVFRESIIRNAIDDVQLLVDRDIDGDIRGTWLLTEIDHFDMEKERIILLCTKSFIIVKYNFIALKQETFKRVPLCVVDKIVVGELAYPERSLTPRIGGVAGGLFGVVKDCIIPRVQGTVQTVGNVIFYRNSKATTTTIDSDNQPTLDEQPQADSYNGAKLHDSVTPPQKPPVSALSLENFEPRTRNVHGIKIMWNQDVPLNFTTKWNPFASIPWITLTSHPLLWHKGGGGGISQSFDIDSFSREFIDILSHSGGGDSSPMCRVEYTTIVIETYVGLTSLFHNSNSLGFYKIRGKLSF